MKFPQSPLFHREGLGPGGFGGDDILIEIMDNGVIKITTDPISGPNHTSAESLLRTVADLAGGQNTRTRRRVTHQKHHKHQDTHTRNT